MNIDGVRDVADAVDQLLRRIVSHDPCQRRIGVEKRAGRRRHINSINRALEQLAIAFLGKALLGQGMNRRLARGIGVNQRAAEHFGGAGDVTDLVVDIGGGNRGVLLASGERADGSRDGLERTDSTAAAGSCASNASAIWFCIRNRFRAVIRSGTSAIAASKRWRTGGNAATSSPRRAINAVTRSMPSR